MSLGRRGLDTIIIRRLVPCAMNALVRVSVVLTNAPYLLNLDCDHCINNIKTLREGMRFMMDPLLGKKVCYVQFPQRFDGIDRSDQYASRNTVFFDINMKGLDGIHGHIYVETGCVFRRQVLYGLDTPKTKKPHLSLFSIFPFIGLLNIATESIKLGMWDGLYDAFHSVDQHICTSPPLSSAELEIIEIEPPCKRDVAQQSSLHKLNVS
ncbi:hypothetical protein GIB67_014417, partial [Kingdonia uniflora]